jgi:hypothetical protein
MKSTIFKLAGMVVLLLIIALPVFAQDNFPDPEDDIPIDGGLTLLLAAGAGYGAKKLRDNRKKKN